MTRAGTAFREASAEPRPASVALSHVSIELGHLYFEDFQGDEGRLARYFRQIAPWISAIRAALLEELGERRPRISTCFLMDDYFGPTLSPRDVLPPVLVAAEEAGLEIDYLARESGCAEADGIALAELVNERIVADPPPDTNGSRPPAKESGWLSNGQRSGVTAAQPGAAMASLRQWEPPIENGTLRHSVFVDVELRGKGKWSCAYLASIWQLLRLGALRHDGAAVAQPRDWEGPWPEDWAELPTVMRLNPRAQPFSAYRTMSVLGGRFLPTEHAVRTILGQIVVDPLVNETIIKRAAAEKLDLPIEIRDRIRYLFV
ncbi:SCO2522 family protein [Dactylosporangium sp. NPDC051541]|uniref:SCO2522 family protein n=1 Tax=Dactylosporangium sp. NPDC051541 TaxID=3363977 RepID=UPI0037A6B51E